MLRLLHICIFATMCALPCYADAHEVHLSDDSVLTSSSPAPVHRLPVLFVHGHVFDADTDDPTNPHYKQNFWEAPDGLTSFKQTLDHNINSGLDIEPYYIRFEDQSRSITADARDIQDAVDQIVQRHNPGFNTTMPAAPPAVQVTIVGYSKGSLSARQYLKSLLVQVQDPAPGVSLMAPRPNYRPVSEFIAIAPPNHGVSFPLSVNTPRLSVRQMHDGVRPDVPIVGCQSFNDVAATDYITRLNGHPVTDTLNVVSDTFPGEAPGFRTESAAPHSGILYVALYGANNNPDTIVGGDSPSTDCHGRMVARNLAGDASGTIAINIPISPIPIPVHANTVHTTDVVCKALFAAVHHRSPAAENCTTVPGSNVPVVRLPENAAAVLALDISGSMSMPACPGCGSRLGVLKDSVELFAQLWAVMGRANDRLGVTYFNSTVTQFQDVNNDTLPTLGSVNDLIADVRSKSPATSTAMGGGLHRSIETLQALPTGAAARRHVVLFTDGMQNVNPMVHELSATPPQHDIRDEPDRPPSGLPPMALNALGGITVDTIGVGAGQAFLALLGDIASETGGVTRSTVNAEDLRQFFVEELIETLRGFSPQLIAYRRGTLATVNTNEAFLVNRSARKVVFKISWPHGQRLNLRIFKDGIDATASARIVAGKFYRILAFDMPAKAAPGALAGDWRIVLAGKPGAAYEAAAIVDEPELRYRVRLGGARNRADAPLTLSVQLRAGTRPIDAAATVTAEIARPRVAIGNLLAQASGTDRVPTAAEPAMTVAERRLAAIANDRKAWSLLVPQRQTIRLQGKKGEYRAAIPNVTVPGLYRVTLRIRGEDSQLGRFERSATATAVVRFGPANRGLSRITLITMDDKDAELTLRPRDRRGNLLGPGLASEVILDLQGQSGARAEDLGDGSYRFGVPRAAGQNPLLTLSVAGGRLFRGRLIELRARR
jgi:hypothetical protein